MNGVLSLLSWGCMALGVFFSLTSVLGLLRFPDVYTRIHAGTKALSGGAVLTVVGVALRLDSWQAMVKAGLIVFFLLATAPLGSHAIARACYRHGVFPPRTVLDDYADVEEDCEP